MPSARLPAWAQPKEIFDLVRLAVPVALSRSSWMLMGLTDAMVLARHAPDELPIVLNGWLPNGVLMGLGMGLLLGVSVLTAELNGSGRGSESGRVFRRGLGVSLVYGVLATLICIAIAAPLMRFVGFEGEMVDASAETTRILAFGIVGHMTGLAATYYLEALRRPNIVTAISMVAVLFNLVMDLVLVPQYGAVGVVWATTASRFLIALLAIGAVVALTPALKRAPLGPPGEFLRQMRVGLGTGIANVAEWGSFNLTFVIATLVSIAAGATYGMTVQFMGVIFMIYVGLGAATSVRVAEQFGRKDAAGVRDASRLGVASSLIMGGLMALALWVGRDGVAALSLNASGESGGAELAPLLASLLGVAAVLTLFDGLQGVCSMALRAQNIVWAPTLVHVGSYMAIMAPLAWYAALHTPLGVWGVMLGVAVASILAGLGQVVLLERANIRTARRLETEKLASEALASERWSGQARP